MGCRPILLTLMLVAAMAAVATGSVGLALTKPEGLTVDLERGLPKLTLHTSEAYVPTPAEVLAKADAAATTASGVPASIAVPLPSAPETGPVLVADPAPSRSTPSPGPTATEDDAYLARLGNPFVASGHDDPGAHSVAPGLATVPPPTYHRSGDPIPAKGEVATQDANARQLFPSKLVGDLATPAVAAVAAGLLLLALAPWALYHRIRGHSTLENATRKSIYDAVCTNPGVGVQEVANAAGVSYSTASYHLDRLVGAGMLVLAAEGARLRYFKNGGAFTEDDRKILPVLESAEACRVLEAVLDRPYTYRAAIAQQLGVSTTTVNWHLKRLLEAGLVKESREGRNAHLVVDRARLAGVARLGDKLANAPESTRRILARAQGGPAEEQPVAA